MITKKEDYNNIPVAYCKTCLSLSIKDIELKTTTSSDIKREVTYCVTCSNTEIEKCHINEWEEKYENKYNKKFLDGGTE